MSNLKISSTSVILRIFRDLLDGMYSVLDEYEENEDSNENISENDEDYEEDDQEEIVDEVDEELEEDKSQRVIDEGEAKQEINDNNKKEDEKTESNSGLMRCSVCTLKKTDDNFGFKHNGERYKSCSKCRDIKKRKYYETKESNKNDSKKIKISNDDN